MPRAYFEQPRISVEDWFLLLKEDLNVANEVIRILDTKFIDLVGSFKDADTLHNEQRREKLLKKTDKYLDDRKLLPDLITAHGAIEKASKDDRLEHKGPDLPKLLTDVAGKIEEYMRELGEVRTGVGREALELLIEKAGKIAGVQEAEDEQVIQEVVSSAKVAAATTHHQVSKDGFDGNTWL
jgi:hypothetical protein